MAQTQTKTAPSPTGGDDASADDKTAQAKDARDDARGEYDEVVSQIARLKADIGALTSSLASLGLAEKDRLVTAAAAKGEDLRATGEARYAEARGTVDDYLRDGERYVREQPGTALGIAAVIGFFLGLFMSRR